MRLSRKSDYALRAVRYCTNLPKGHRGSINSIAESESIPREFLAKILRDLTAGGILASHQGVKGGYTLARQPSDIMLSEILYALEGSCCLVECVEDKDYCPHYKQCATHDVWKEASFRLKNYFENLSLQDLMKISALKARKAVR